MAALRAVGLIGAVAMMWTAGAAHVAGHVKHPVSSVVAGAVVTQQFGCTSVALEPFSPWCPLHRFHGGIDLAAPEGSAVLSATDGSAHVGFDPAGAGNFVAVQYDAHTRLLYCHLSRVFVRPGEHIEPGQPIGAVGATGLATGPHVHFEIDVDGVPVDPSRWLDP